MESTGGIKVILERNRIVVTGYPPPSKGSSLNLPYVFCVFDAKIKRYIKDKRYSYYDEKTGDIIMPRTAALEKILQRIRSSGFMVEGVYDESNTNLIEYRDMSTEITMKPGINPRDEFQVNAVNFLTKPIGGNVHYRRLSLPTGDGKTFCALFAVARYGRKTLIVADSLVDQWAAEILDKLTISYKKIFEIKDSVDTVRYLLSKDVHPSKYDIYVASLRTLVNAHELGLYEPMCRKLGIGLKIIDEIHLSTYSQVWLDMQAAIQETIYLSATPARSSPNEDYVFKLVFKELPSYGEEVWEMKKKYLRVINIEYDSHPDYTTVAKCTTFYGFQTARFAEHIFSPKCRDIIFDILKYVIDLTIQYVAEDEKIVIIFERLVDVRMTNDVLKRLYPNIPVGDYTSNSKKEDKVDNLKNKIILSTDDSFGTGSDLKGKLRVLVNTTTYNSKVTAKQLPGRLRDIPGKAVYYIDLVNVGFKRTTEHFYNRSKIINQFASNVTKRVYGVDI